jgi:hypothetical protein
MFRRGVKHSAILNDVLVGVCSPAYYGNNDDALEDDDTDESHDERALDDADDAEAQRSSEMADLPLASRRARVHLSDTTASSSVRRREPFHVRHFCASVSCVQQAREGGTIYAQSPGRSPPSRT